MYLARGSSKSLLAHLGYIFSLVLLINIFHGNFVTGSPLQKRQDDGIEPDDPSSDVDSPGGDPFSIQVDEYPDLAKCQEKCSVAKDKSVFYSKVGDHNDKPQKFADQLPDGVLMRESFPSGFTDRNPNYTGYKKFMERTSQAFAEKTSGVAYVLLPTDSNTDISNSVWTKIEKPALTASNGECTRIIKADPDKFNSQCILWDRDGNNDANLANCNVENGPVPSPRSTSSYSPGWCSVHVVQYQKTNPDDPTSHYHLDVTIFDNTQKQIGQVLDQDAPSEQGVDVESALPYVLIVTAQNVDEDAVLFNYAGQAWGSNDQPHHCNFGAYDSGSRNGDCGFSC